MNLAKIQTPEVLEGQRWMRELFSNLVPLTPETKERRLAVIRRMAVQARRNPEARSYMEWALGYIAMEMPAEVEAFRAYFFAGRSARSIGRVLCADKRTVYRYINRVLETMLPLVFGLDGLYEGAPGTATGG